MFCISSIDKTVKKLTPEAKKAAKVLKKAMKGYTPVDPDTLKTIDLCKSSAGKSLVNNGKKVNLIFENGTAMLNKKDKCTGTFSKILNNGDKAFLKFNEGKIQSSIRTGERNFIKVYEYSNSDPNYNQSKMVSKYDLNHQLREIIESKKNSANESKIEITKYNADAVSDKTTITTTKPCNDPIKMHLLDKNGEKTKYIQVGVEKPILAETATEKV